MTNFDSKYLNIMII